VFFDRRSIDGFWLAAGEDGRRDEDVCVEGNSQERAPVQPMTPEQVDHLSWCGNPDLLSFVANDEVNET